MRTDEAIEDFERRIEASKRAKTVDGRHPGHPVLGFILALAAPFCLPAIPEYGGFVAFFLPFLAAMMCWRAATTAGSENRGFAIAGLVIAILSCLFILMIIMIVTNAQR